MPRAAPARWAGPEPASWLLCGDFNLRVPDELTLRLIEDGAAPGTALEWVYGRSLGCAAPPPADAARCVAPLGLAGRCPAAVVDGGRLCWDHRCQCGAEKENKRRHCATFAATSPPPPTPPPPRPPDGSPIFAPQLTVPLRLASAYERVTGSHLLLHPPFNIRTGEAVEPHVEDGMEGKDHIFFGGAHALDVRWVLPPPPVESLRPSIPNLSWPSDHVALVADFAWA